MADDVVYGLKLRFKGQRVDREGLDLYEGAASFHGFAQALQIAVHAYQTREVVSRATALKRAQLFFGSPRRGSVVFDIEAHLRRSGAAIGKTPSAFYDFMRVAFARATGQSNVVAETPAVAKLDADDTDTLFDDLSVVLEGSLQRGHRAIDDGVPQVVLERPRAALVTFNAATSEWVNTRDEDPAVQEFGGNVTRYNSVSGNGRAYIRELRKIVPIRPKASFPDSKRGHLTWSLHGATTDGVKELKFIASRIDSAHGDPKRLLLVDCSVAEGL